MVDPKSVGKVIEKLTLTCDSAVCSLGPMLGMRDTVSSRSLQATWLNKMGVEGAIPWSSS